METVIKISLKELREIIKEETRKLRLPKPGKHKMKLKTKEKEENKKEKDAE